MKRLYFKKIFLHAHLRNEAATSVSPSITASDPITQKPTQRFEIDFVSLQWFLAMKTDLTYSLQLKFWFDKTWTKSIHDVAFMCAFRPVIAVTAVLKFFFMKTDVSVTIFQDFNQLFISCKFWKLSEKQLYEHVLLNETYEGLCRT